MAILFRQILRVGDNFDCVTPQDGDRFVTKLSYSALGDQANRIELSKKRLIFNYDIHQFYVIKSLYTNIAHGI